MMFAEFKKKQHTVFGTCVHVNLEVQVHYPTMTDSTFCTVWPLPALGLLLQGVYSHVSSHKIFFHILHGMTLQLLFILLLRHFLINFLSA